MISESLDFCLLFTKKKNIVTSKIILTNCAAEAAFRAEQLKVAIP
jgi:hypothetical protein